MQNPTNSTFYPFSTSDFLNDDSSQINTSSVCSGNSSSFDGNSTETSNFSLSSDPAQPSLKDELILK